MRSLIAKTMHKVANALAPGESGWIDIERAMALPSIGGVSSAAGKIVNANKAMCVSAVWSCIRRSSEMIGALPGGLFQKDSNGTRVSIDDDLVSILGVKPNAHQTSMEFWEGQVAQILLDGNGISERLNNGNRLVGLSPIHGATPKWDRSTRSFNYEFMDRGKRQVLPAEKVFHIRGFGAGDGIGLSAIKHGAQSIGSALAADETAGAVFANGLLGVTAIETDGDLTDEQRGQLQTLLDTFRASKNAGKILPLEHGFKLKNMQINPEDAQLLETRRFQVEDVCRWFGVPPIVIGHASEGQTMWGSGVEAILLAWLTMGINPMLRRIEKRILCDLVPSAKRSRWFWEWNREAMLQMDSRAKGDFLLKMRMAGFMSGDEGRDKLNLPRRGGQNDELLVQTALQLVDLLGKEGTK